MDYNFRSYIEYTENGKEYFVDFPDLKACGGCGKTELEALEMAIQNRDIYIQEISEDGRELPSAVY